MRRMVKIVLIAFILVGIAVPQLSCGSESGETEAMESQIVTVERGTLTVEITAAGNLALSRTEDIAFDLFYPEGTVAEVLVEEGDTVEEGQVLAKVDPEEWDDELSTVEKALVTAQRNLSSKERAVTTAERQVTTLEREVSDKEDDVTTAERQVTAKELAVSQAQLDLETAEYNLSEIDEVKEAQDAIDKAESNLELAIMGLTGAFGGGLQTDFTYWSNLKTKAEEELAEAQQDLQDILEDKDITLSRDVALEVADKQLKVKQKQLALNDAQIAVDEAKRAVEDAKLAVEDAKYDVEDARQDLEDANHAVEDAQSDLNDAQQELEKAKSKSPLIVAPFAGFITKVNVEGGDDIMTGTVAVQLADPNRFEADIMVSEMDILQVKLGGDATVQVDAMPGLSLPAKITHIAPTATIQSGVVNYQVKVEVQPLEQRQAGQQPQTQISPVIPEGFQLREGLTVTVTIIVQQKTDVLLVPNAAITSQGGQSYVQVVSPDGATEQRAIKTGISDYQFTEVTEGLSEGEQILVPKGTATTATTTQPARPPMMIPGMGPPSR